MAKRLMVVCVCLLAMGSSARAQDPYNLSVPVKNLATLFTGLYGPNGLVVDSLATLPGEQPHTAHFNSDFQTNFSQFSTALVSQLFTRKLAASLCYVGLVRLDTIEMHGFSNRLGHRVVSNGGRHRFPGVMDGISVMAAAGHTDYLGVIREFISTYSQRGLVIIISDFLDDAGCERALQYLSDYGHELMLLQIWADEDRTPPWTGELELRDAETGAGLKLDFDDEARRRYTHAFDEYASTIQTMAHRSGGRYAGIATSQSLESVIFGDLIKMRGIA